MLAKCGEVRTNHWAHKGIPRCDTWWENETEWHRNWKNLFLDDWQEVVHIADDGERHIADIKTPNGWIIEFQHSYIKPEERRSRENFYQKMLWVVDGKRRIRDKTKFFEILRDSHLSSKYQNLKETFPEGALLRDWINSNSLVFFDFGESDLWCLLSGSDEYYAYIVPIAKDNFLKLLTSSQEGLDDLIKKYNLIAPTKKLIISQ